MISCEECQKKLVAVFDNEGCEGDEELIKAHLRDCPACRAFREDMARLRRQFASVDVPELPRMLRKELVQVVRADSLRRENRPGDNRAQKPPLLLRFPLLVRAAGLAALFLILVSLLACYTLSRKVSNLRGRLEASQRQLASVRHDLVVAQATKKRQEDRQKEQKAISALYFRMQELEERFNRFSSPRTTFMPAERSRPSGAYGDVKTDVLHEN
jgi:Putative zinc-finger